MCMASTSPPTCLKALNFKHYILAVLMATLAAAVVVTVFFVVLSPARIYFSVTNPSSNVSRDGSVDLVLTLAANNTSQRAAVWYQTILIDVTNDTGTLGSMVAPTWVRAVITNTSAIMSQWQPHGSVVTVDATVWVAPGDPWTAPFITGRCCRADDMHSSTPFSIQITAVVRFKVGIARTRLYDIKVICSPVSFLLPQQNRRRGSAAASAAHVLPPVACEPN